MTTIGPSLGTIVESSIVNAGGGSMSSSDLSRILAKLEEGIGKDLVTLAELSQIDATINRLVRQGRINKSQGDNLHKQIKGSINKAVESNQLHASEMSRGWLGFTGHKGDSAIRNMAHQAATNKFFFGHNNITPGEVSKMLQKASEDGTITLNEINAMYSGINDAFNNGRISMQERNKMTKQLEVNLKRQTGTRKGACARRIKGPYADKLSPVAKDFVQQQLGGKMSRSRKKGWTTWKFDRARTQNYVKSITKDGHVSQAERSSLINHVLRDGRATFSELQSIRQAFSWAMWRRDITPQEYNRTLKLFDIEIAKQTGGVTAGQLQQQLMVQQQGMFIFQG